MSDNEYGQPVGDPVDWTPPDPITRAELTGRTCRVVPLDPEHLPALYEALCVRSEPQLWTYLGGGPFDDEAAMTGFLLDFAATPATVTMTIEVDGRPLGTASFMRITPPVGVAELGGIVLADELQRTVAATEALSLMTRHAFDSGYRRWEWKCDALNAPSRRAAERLGFTFEGVFRQGVVYKGRNRDTAWFSITDAEWDDVRRAHEEWLEPVNFDDSGRQRSSLTEVVARMRTASPDAGTAPTPG